MRAGFSIYLLKIITAAVLAVMIMSDICAKPAMAESPFTAFGERDTNTYIYYRIAEDDEYSEALNVYYLEEMVHVFEYRGLLWGFDDLVITHDGRNEVLVKVPAEDDLDDVLEVLETPSRFCVRTPDNQTILTGEYLKTVYVTTDSHWDGLSEEQYSVIIELNDEAAELFEGYTRRYLGQQLLVYVDNQLILSPTVQSVVTGYAAVTGMDKDTADDIARRLISCHLPVEIMRDHVYRAPNLFERLLGIKPVENEYEPAALKPYLDETLI